MDPGIKYCRISSLFACMLPVGVFIFLTATPGFVREAVAHESPPVRVELSAIQDRVVQMQVSLELEKYLFAWESSFVDEHSEAAEAGYDGLRELAPEALREKYRAALRAGFNAVQLFVGHGRKMPLILESIDIAAPSGATARRSTTLTFSAILPKNTVDLKLRAGMDNAAMIVSHAHSGSQHRYVPAGELSGDIKLRGNRELNRITLFTEYLAAGFSHIVPKGFDHVLFIVGLVLMATGWKPLAVQVSLFTLAHSITLALGILGLVRVPGAVVEPLIAASIIYVCVESLRGTGNPRWRGIIIVIFGLLHGLGFASMLSMTGLQAGSLVFALFAFNLGIEIAQLSIVLVFMLVVGVARRCRAFEKTRVSTPASLAIGLAGTCLLIERVVL